MVIVRITGNRVGVPAVPLIKLIKKATGLLLKPSKDLGERVLAGETIEFEVPSARVANRIVGELAELGVVASCEG